MKKVFDVHAQHMALVPENQACFTDHNVPFQYVDYDLQSVDEQEKIEQEMKVAAKRRGARDRAPCARASCAKIPGTVTLSATFAYHENGARSSDEDLRQKGWAITKVTTNANWY